MAARLLALVLLAAGLLPLGAGPANAAPPYTSWALRAAPGSAAPDAVYGPETSLRVSGDRNRVQVLNDHHTLSVAAPGDEPLVVGRTYTGATFIGSEVQPELGFIDDGCSGSANHSFTVRELLADAEGDVVGINLVYQLSCDGGPPHGTGSVAVNSTIAPVLLAPTLYADLQGRKVRYGDDVTLGVRLSADAPTHEVGVYLTPPGLPETLLTTATTGGNGRTKVTIRPKLSGVVTVKWPGGAGFPALAVTDTVSVPGKVVSRLRGSTGRQGRTRLYPASRDATLVAVVVPTVHRGACVRFDAQYFVRGSWGYDAHVKCVKLDKNSAGAVRVPGDRRLVGVPIRLRAVWRGDELSTKAKGKWRYLRFTGGGARSRSAAARMLQQPERLGAHAVQGGELGEVVR